MVPQRTGGFSDSDAPTRTDEKIREQLHKAIAAEVADIQREGTAIRVSKELGRSVLESVTEVIFAVALREGYFRFPNGYGSLKVQRLKQDPKPKRLPDGTIIDMPSNRVRLRYEEGAAVREKLNMPPKTNYVRRFNRTSTLRERAREILGETV